MIHRIPPELEILIEIYTIAKTLRRNEKPDYLKLIKKVLNIMAAFQMKSRQSTSELHLSIAGSISNIREKLGNKKSSEPIGEADVNVKVGELNAKRRDSKDGPKVKFNV